MSSQPAPLAERQPVAPVHLEKIVEACLEKDPDDRWESARDLATELRWLAAGGPRGVSGEAGPTPSRLPLVAAGLTGGALLAALVMSLLGGAAAGPGGSAAEPVRAVMPLPESVGQGRARRPALAIAPDGRSVVYVAAVGATTELKIRRFDSFDSVAVPGTQSAQGPFFSPDGQWVGYFAEGELRRVPLSGGMPSTIVAARDVRGAVWLPDDTILYTPSFTSGLVRVAANGGTPVTVTEPDQASGEKSHRWPFLLPDDKTVLFTIGTTSITTFDDAPIGILDLETGRSAVLASGGAFPQYSAASGHLVYARNGSLLASEFDLDTWEVHGTPVRVVDGVVTSPTYGTAAYALSRDSALVFVPGRALRGNGTLVWVDRQGNAVPISSERRDYLTAAVSPDGTRLALEIGGANDSLWTYDLARDVLARLTFFQGDLTATVWSPDGSKLAFTVPQPDRVLWIAADGSGVEKELLAGEMAGAPTSWTPDGEWLLLNSETAADRTDILALPAEGGVPTPVLASPFDEEAAASSPDGRWIAYESDFSGRREVYVTSFPEPGRRVQISQAGGLAPVWRRDQSELFFRSGDQVLAAAVQPGETFSASAPRVLFEGNFQSGVFDVDADGRRFVMVRTDELTSPAQLNLIVNFGRELAALPRRR